MFLPEQRNRNIKGDRIAGESYWEPFKGLQKKKTNFKDHACVYWVHIGIAASGLWRFSKHLKTWIHYKLKMFKISGLEEIKIHKLKFTLTFLFQLL